MIRGFDFGANWDAYSETKLDDARVEKAVQSLKQLLRRETLEGSSFLDIGSGSGLFSIAAYHMKAARVVGIDVNSRCIVVAERNRDRLSAGAVVSFVQTSVLSSQDLQSLGEFDLVYAWGSLHHTGAMWDAIRNTACRVEANGTLVLGIYNKHWTSPVWKLIKRFYNSVPRIAQRILIPFFAAIIYVAKFLVTWRNPLDKERGMDFWYDVIDWVGGYPYEYATPCQVQDFVQSLGFTLQHWVGTTVPTGCNEFVFTRAA